MAKLTKFVALSLTVALFIFILYAALPFIYNVFGTRNITSNAGNAGAISNNGDASSGSVNATSNSSNIHSSEEEFPLSSILYLMQAEQCLPSYYQSSDVLGNGNFGFEVIVLSYKEACPDSSMPHVQYLLDKSTTWTTGRNLLFEAAMNRSKTYLYYVFMDDDIYLEDTNHANPWRKYESFLRTFQPAISCVDPEMAQKVRSFHVDHHCSGEGNSSIGTVWFDAIFDAFHYKAIRHILPYDPTFDQQTWWASQMSVIIRSEVLFRGQIAIHTEVHGDNKNHRPYPRDFNFTPQMIHHMTEGLDRVVPADRAECANAIIQQWRTTYHWTHGTNSPTLCLPPPSPRDEIAPGRYACY
eukprot:Em0014g874a